MTPADVVQIRDRAAAAVIAKVLQREGGIKNIGDGAGLTRFGQTPAWLETYGLKAPQTVEQADANYRAWLVATKLIALCDVADALADIAIDFAVNAGAGVAVRSVQAALGVRPDGSWGPLSSAALATADRRAIACRVLADRARHNGRLITDKPEKFAQWAKGWANRVAEQIEALA